MKTEKFDMAHISITAQKFLERFAQRRAKYDEYIKINHLKLFTCPSCGYPTLGERGGYEICPVCNWEDDGQDNHTATERLGGPNGGLTLIESRIDIETKFQHIIDEKALDFVENPQEVLEILKNHYQKMRKIGKKIPMNATLKHPAWQNWRNEKEKLKYELMEKK